VCAADKGKVSITDLSSTNGTFVNDEELVPMRSQEVPIGAEVIFGDIFLAKFLLEEQPDEQPDDVPE
jgi:pSer/pThr/pTyr-binding forkhead associated (FHA) protein